MHVGKKQQNRVFQVSMPGCRLRETAVQIKALSAGLNTLEIKLSSKMIGWRHNGSRIQTSLSQSPFRLSVGDRGSRKKTLRPAEEKFFLRKNEQM